MSTKNLRIHATMVGVIAWVTAVFASLFLIAVVLPPVTHAQTDSGSTDPLKCEFRQLTDASSDLGETLCWINFKDFDFRNARTNKVPMEIKLFPYVLRFNVQVNDKGSVISSMQARDLVPGQERFNPGTSSIQVKENGRFVDTPTKITWDKAVFGRSLEKDGSHHRFFVPEADSTQAPAVGTTIRQRPYTTGSNPRMRISDISFEHTDGGRPEFSLIVADAESTTNRGSESSPEFIGLKSFGGGRFTALSSIEALDSPGIPSAPTCGGGLKTDHTQQEFEVRRKVNYTYDLLCVGGTANPQGRGVERSGVFLAKADNPSDFEVTLGGIQNQAVAFALKMRSVGAQVHVARSAENNVIDGPGQPVRHSDFDVETRIVVPGSGIRSSLGNTQTVVHKTNPAERTMNFVSSPGQKLEFVSKVTTAAGTDEVILARFRPEWRCTHQARSGSDKIPITPEVVNDIQRPRTTATIDVPDSGFVECSIFWRERYARTGVINIAKTVGEGIQESDFIFTWKCDPPQPEFLVAYAYLGPRWLSGSRTVRAGRNVNITGLPVGARCSFSETGTKSNHTLAYTVNGRQTPISNVITVGRSVIRLQSRSELIAREIDVSLSSELAAEPTNSNSDHEGRHQARVHLRCEDSQEQTTSLPYNSDATRPVIVNKALAIDSPCTITFDQNRNQEEKRNGYIDAVTLEYNGQEIPGVMQGDPKNGVFQFEIRLSPNSISNRSIAMVFKPRLRSESHVLEISKVNTGPAASRLIGTPMTIHWRCFVPGIEQPREGQFDATSTPQVIANLPFDATCFVWEEAPVLPIGVQQKGETTVERVDAERRHVQPNSQAKRATRDSPDHILPLKPGINKVVLTGTYIHKVAPLHIAINSIGPAAHHSTISTYPLQYNCGVTTIDGPNGPLTIALAGSTTVAAGVPTALRFNGQHKDLVTNGAGELQIPVGNTCSVTVDRLWLPPGIGAQAPIVPNVEIQEGDNTVNAEVNYTYLGEGLTVAATFGTNPELAQPIPTAVVCSRPGIIGIFSRVFELSPDSPQVQFTPEEVPAASDCAVTMAEDTGNRTLDGRRALSVRSLGLTGLADTNVTDNRKLEVYRIRIPDENSVINIQVDYEYVMRTVSFAATNVEKRPELGVFADHPETQNFGPKASVTCQLPNGTEQQHVVSMGQDPTAAQITVPAFSQCSASQGAVQLPDTVTVETASATLDRTGDSTISFAATEDNQAVRFTNTFDRAATSITVATSFNVPNNAAVGGTVIPATPTAAATVACTHGGREVFNRQLDLQPGDNPVADVPAGLECTVAARNAALEVGFTVDGAQDQRTAYLDPEVRWIITDRGQSSEASGSEAADEATNASPSFRSVADHGGTGNANRVNYAARYQWRMGQVDFAKQVTGAANHLEALKRTARDLEFSFAATCASPDSTAVDSSGLAATVPLSKFTGTDTVAVGKLRAPIGSVCTITEAQDQQLPQGFSITPQPDAQVTASLDDATPQRLTMTNHVTRTTTPYEVIVATAGEDSLRHGDTQLQFHCVQNGHKVDVAAPTVTVAREKQPHLLQLTDLSRVAMDTDNPVYHLPIGAQCTVTAGGSALDPRPELKAVGTPPHRVPPTVFALGDKVVRNQPDGDVAELGDYSIDDGILEAWNKHSFTFTVDELTDVDSVPLFAISQLIRDKVDITVGKTIAGTAPKTEFPVTVDCGTAVSAGDVSPRRDLRVTDVPVGSACSVTETHGGTGDGSTPTVDWDFGAGLVAQQPPQNETALVTVQPVAEVGDSSADNDRWRMSIRNSYPQLSLTRSIAGAGILGAIVLPPDATTATVEYTVRNDGATPLRGITISEDNSPLAGCTVPDLNPGASHTCYKDMTLAQPGVMETHEGHATAAATDTHNRLTATASTTVIRLPLGGAWQLPDTGVRTLVLILLLGLAVLGFAVVRYIRSVRSEAVS